VLIYGYEVIIFTFFWINLRLLNAQILRFSVCNKRRLVIVFWGLGDSCLLSLSQDRDHSKYVTLQWICRNHFASNAEYVSLHCVAPMRKNAVKTI